MACMQLSRMGGVEAHAEMRYSEEEIDNNLHGASTASWTELVWYGLDVFNRSLG
jgi:hypothetical protein